MESKMVKNILNLYKTWSWPASPFVSKKISWELSDWPVLLYLFFTIIIPWTLIFTY